MKFNSSKLLFFLILLITLLMMLSSNSMILLWMNLEMNMMVIMPIISETKIITDQLMKYFIIQGASSSMFLLSMILSMIMEKSILDSNLLLFSMMTKMGLMPVHLWMPELLKKISWMSCLIMTTIQKIPATIMLSQLTETMNLLLTMNLSAIISPISGMKQTSTKKMIAYSSIMNSIWMILSMKISKQMFNQFFMIYLMIMIISTLIFKKLKINFMNQIKSTNKKNQLSILINMISMSGMPPTMGFLPKWMILKQIIYTLPILSFSLILSSMISMFMYMKFIYPMMTLNLSTKFSKTKKKHNLFISLIINTMGVMMMIK